MVAIWPAPSPGAIQSIAEVCHSDNKRFRPSFAPPTTVRQADTFNYAQTPQKPAFSNTLKYQQQRHTLAPLTTSFDDYPSSSYRYQPLLKKDQFSRPMMAFSMPSGVNRFLGKYSYESNPKQVKLFTFIAVSIGNLLIAIDACALATILPTLAHDLKLDSVQAFWAGTAYLLCQAVFQPLATAFADIFGRRSVSLASVGLFTIGSAVCGSATNAASILSGRVIQGMGAAGILSLTYVLMTDLLKLHERSKMLALIGQCWLVGTVFGPIIAGGFATGATWRWTFYFNLPFCGILLVLLLLFVDSPYRPQGTIKQRLWQFDWFGAFLLVASLTTFLIGLSWGGIMYPWSNAQTVLPLVVGATGLLWWIAYSEFLTTNPIIPLNLLKNRTAAIAFPGNIVQGVAQVIMIYNLPLYFQAVKGYSAVISGVALLPGCFTSGTSTMITAILINKTGHIKLFMLIGWAIYTFGMGILALLKPGTPVTAWIFINAPAGIGLGMVYTTLAMATQIATEATDKRDEEEINKVKGMAASLNPFFRSIGQSLGVVIGQATFTNELKKRAGDSIARDAAAAAEMIRLMPPSEAKQGLILALSQSLRPVFLVGMALCALWLVLSFFVRDKRMPRAAVEGDKEMQTASGTIAYDAVPTAYNGGHADFNDFAALSAPKKALSLSAVAEVSNDSVVGDPRSDLERLPGGP